MAKNKVILTGFMGCGKSTIGRILAEKRGQELLDTDHYIEQKQGRSISDIFLPHRAKRRSGTWKRKLCVN